MWILAIAPLIAYGLAGYDVARFFELWDKGWPGLLTATGMGLGIKFGKDTMIRKAELQANVDAGVSNPTKLNYTPDGSD